MSEFYKSLTADGYSCHGGNCKWSLPKLKPDGTYRPGRWMPVVADIKLCERGYRLFRREGLLYWLGESLYEAEGRGEMVEGEGKVAFAQARLLRPIPGYNERTLRLFACRVAEDVLQLFESTYPNDDRPRRAIEAARRHVSGELTAAEVTEAAEAARAAAARAAAARATAAWAAAAWAAASAAWTAAEAVPWKVAWTARLARAATGEDATARYTAWLWEMLEVGDE